MIHKVVADKLEEVGNQAFYHHPFLYSFPFKNLKKIGEAAFRKTNIRYVKNKIITRLEGF